MPRTLNTVDQAVALLELFDADRTEWTLSDLAHHLNQPISTVHDQLLTLSASGLLMKVGRGRYRLGWRLLKLSSALYGSLPWYGPAHDAMNALARGTHALAFLAVLQRGAGHGAEVLCIARSVQGREGESVVGETQFVLPPHASASGKLLFALHHLDLHHLDLPAGLPTLSWAEEATTIREQQLASTRDLWSVGTSGLAAPIRGEGGEVLGALGLSFPTSRWREHETLVRRLRDTATEVSWALGDRP